MVMLPVPGALMRRFVVDWLARLDTAVPPLLMAPDYTVSIGGIELRGLDTYVPATVEVYERYQGLLLTVHDALAAPGRTALRFTLHGAEPDRAPVAWGGIALFAHDGRVLTRSWVEEDYLARRRQQADGTCDPIEAPMPAPWALTETAGNAADEAAVREWLAAGELEPVAPSMLKGGAEVTEIFSAGDRVAFHAVQRGVYLGGLPDTVDAAGREAVTSLVGIVRCTSAGPRGHIVVDQLGLRRRLMKGGV